MLQLHPLEHIINVNWGTPEGFILGSLLGGLPVTYYSSDGEHWEQGGTLTTSATPQQTQALAYGNGVWVAGRGVSNVTVDNGAVLTSEDKGETWTVRKTFPGSAGGGIFDIIEEIVFVTPEVQTDEPAPIGQFLLLTNESIAFPNPGSNNIWRSEDGHNWTQLSRPWPNVGVDDNARSLSVANKRVFVGWDGFDGVSGTESRLFQSDDAGETWTNQVLFTDADGPPLIRGVAYDSRNEKYVLVARDFVIKRSDTGTTWGEDFSPSAGPGLTYNTGANNSRCIAIGTVTPEVATDEEEQEPQAIAIVIAREVTRSGEGNPVTQVRLGVWRSIDNGSWTYIPIETFSGPALVDRVMTCAWSRSIGCFVMVIEGQSGNSSGSTTVRLYFSFDGLTWEQVFTLTTIGLVNPLALGPVPSSEPETV